MPQFMTHEIEGDFPMRAISYISIVSTLLLASFSSISATAPANAQKARHGLENAQEVIAHSTGLYYLQAGKFQSASGADRYKKQLANQFHQPVMVKTRGQFHVVLIGPFKTFSALRAFSSKDSELIG